jgi:hypothetical protein
MTWPLLHLPQAPPPAEAPDGDGDNAPRTKHIVCLAVAWILVFVVLVVLVFLDVGRIEAP